MPIGILRSTDNIAFVLDHDKILKGEDKDKRHTFFTSNRFLLSFSFSPLDVEMVGGSTSISAIVTCGNEMGLWGSCYSRSGPGCGGDGAVKMT